jgi:CDP-diacylglycerol--glycerol-3-phosphate 3-phosphatidyltransferase
MTLTMATRLTLARLALLPLLLLLFWWPGQALAAAAVFTVAAVTDFVDGWVARRWNQQTAFGAMLDQISDKILVLVTLLLLLSEGKFAPWVVVAAVILLCRELWVAGLREYMGANRVVVPVARLGKYKTAVQMVALCLLLLARVPTSEESINWLRRAGEGFLLLAVLLSVSSGWTYSMAAWRAVTSRRL